ncbi:MAG: leucyl aminopeptidase family protein [Streptosporangiaceae bacterium]
MPVISSVTPLSLEGQQTAGGFLRAVDAGQADPADIVVVAVADGGETDADDALDARLAVPAPEIVAAGRMSGQAGQIVPAAVRSGGATVRVVFLGVGDRSAAALRRAGGELGRMLRPGERAVASVVAGQPYRQVLAFAEGVLLGSYRFSEKSAAAADQGPRAGQAEVGLTGTAGTEAAIAEATTIAAATGVARDLTNTPSLRKTPQWLAGYAARVADGASANGARADGAGADGASLRVRVWDEAELAGSGFGGITAVGSGSDRPPRLIELTYTPAASRPPRHVVLVGKGITFDSGGLSLKPNDAMKAMKTDMAGGAAVIAAMSALASLGIPDKVTGLVAAAENLPSGSAYRPGDVLTMFGGATVEVLNTDAEGRLVLADAIAYANARLGPDLIVDLATLTGAARIALGSSRAALYSTSDELAAALLAAGEASGDRLWRMPLTSEYRPALDSPVADLSNVPREPPGAGSITAALFLREFAGRTPWAHLDIAAAARSGSDDGELTAGGTGFGVRLLLRWLQQTAAGPRSRPSRLLRTSGRPEQPAGRANRRA